MHEAAPIQDLNETLRNFQGVLSSMFSVQDEIREIPRTLETKEELLNRSKKSYLEYHEKSERAKDEMKSLRIQLDDAERAREKSEKQMDEISTQREFEALDKEIKDAAAKEQQIRKNLLNKERYSGELDVKLEEQEALIAMQEEDVAGEREKMDSQISGKQQELVALEAQREGYAAKIEELLIKHAREIDEDLDKEGVQEFLFKFERIIKNKGGIGIVAIHGLVCQGCHMTLPIQFVNDVRKAQKPKFCPYCSRVLYYEEVEGAEKQFQRQRVEDIDIEEESLADFVNQDEFDDFI